MMRDLDETRLKQHAEKIVRPIRASHWRKNRMREELLDHLLTAFESELRVTTDPEVACTKAVARIGEVATLRSELQATVPSIEATMAIRLPFSNLIDDWFEKRPGMSSRAFASSRGLVAALACGALLALALSLAVTISWLQGLPGPQILEKFARAGKLSIGLLLALTSTIWFTHWLLDRTGRRQLLSKDANLTAREKTAAAFSFHGLQALLLLASLCSVVTLLAPEGLLVELYRDTSVQRLAVGFTLSGLLGMLIVVWLTYLEEKQHERYGRLRIDE